jgi:metallophosphoesterase (TIGR00282 family)
MREFTVLFIGDVIGQPGTRALFSLLPELRKQHRADLVVVNGENAADGFGMTPQLVQQIFACGANVITTGNHIWHDRDIYPVLEDHPHLLRPANYPSGAPGKGLCVVELKGTKAAVINLQGRERMWPIDCPFKKGKELVRKARAETPIILVDFHADATEEKEALAHHLDGEVSALVGTHTHVQTADERISAKGSAYITDIGATGPRQSIIGFDPKLGIERSLTMLPIKNEVSGNNAWVRGAVVKIDADTGKALSIERVAQLSLV